MGSTAVLLVGLRALLSSILPNNESKKDDVYRHGSPFELFEVFIFHVQVIFCTLMYESSFILCEEIVIFFFGNGTCKSF